MPTKISPRVFDGAGYHVEYGRHSNIPECCIEFFTFKFPRIFRDAERLAEHNRLQILAEARIGRPFHYRPCLDCMRRGHWHRIHKCSGPCANLNLRLQAKYSGGFHG